MKNILVINGSAGEESSNQRLIDHVVDLSKDFFHCSVWRSLKSLPHFDPELSVGKVPDVVINFRKKIEDADGVLICTPEYIFSIPSGLKNAIEWCVSTTVFSDKPVGIITASARGEKGHEELQMIMRTLMAKFTAEATLLISGIKGKITQQGRISDEKMKEDLDKFIQAFKYLVEQSGAPGTEPEGMLP